MGKLKESIIVAAEHNNNDNLVIDTTIDLQQIIDSLMHGAVAFTMLSNHCPADEKHYFLDKRDQLTNSAAVLTSLL
ncbi:MAG: hypothetical protein LW696_07275 [Alphaproteobacteria bacterium]|jgi:hypothetical protein|nr:hypothetical protein [Alphaproteobacteria bacterium]